ncbi:oligopeptide ABC transporter ATP-binding protein [Thermacetogenium phaeum DSM 12270]|uniref:Nickel import system ATP-binding protein NikD n=1 Tax=Thermacetogenium phaeum (strain ATCC BAA-254 / DSM 26808 / PB) TaxID=1089553 RepID=K4LES9_THEPS|nr:ABC transporter ATP-binding protein [Thermacetogenium phaeum]AFV10602.1 oligopeptide ABC transporter ATP-binding protein [Thermacetogenium phaeum DSM 12270]MDK2880288.1 peptide/nickel transport system ATP-binding protein [Clostridia bacterium]MDN5364993.1 peptide/nickel transport system ATP-binding protein [Thermacetogenium sp.]
MNRLLSIRNLRTVFHTEEGLVKVADDINLDIAEGRTVGLIGETGCGKSVLGLSILRLLPPNVSIEGKIYYKGQDILQLGEEQMRRLRGKEIALIPQSPSTSLNPVLKIGVQITEALQLHRKLTREKAEGATLELLRFLNLPEPDNKVKEYPHQLSGGMKQRVLAAIGMAGKPSLLIADEPTKGLDAIIRIQVVEVLRRLTKETGAAMLLITHDLKVAASLCDEIAVMYAGEIVEHGPAERVLKHPGHPYTRGLLASLPDNGLKPIPGSSPSLVNLPAGCKFHPRCAGAREVCAEKRPPLIKTNGCLVRCMFVDQGGESQESFCHRGLQKEAG